MPASLPVSEPCDLMFGSAILQFCIASFAPWNRQTLHHSNGKVVFGARAGLSVNFNEPPSCPARG